MIETDLMRAQDETSDLYKQSVIDQNRLFKAADKGDKGWLNREEWGAYRTEEAKYEEARYGISYGIHEDEAMLDLEFETIKSLSFGEGIT